jgi:hypothetical protein
VGILNSRAVTLVTLIELAGCYSPDLSDCTLPCATSADCAGDQVCSADKTCASPMASCSSGVDAMAPPGDMVPVTVTITGNGNVMIGPVNCASTSCTFELAQGMPANAMAMAKNGDMFTSWTSIVCAAQPMNCAFTPTGPTELAVLFSKKD